MRTWLADVIQFCTTMFADMVAHRFNAMLVQELVPSKMVGDTEVFDAIAGAADPDLAFGHVFGEAGGGVAASGLSEYNV